MGIQDQLTSLTDLLLCTACGGTDVTVTESAVTCRDCETIHPVRDGVLDMMAGHVLHEAPLYANPFYQKFIAAQAELHTAHYAEGSLSGFLEVRFKKDLLSLVQDVSAPVVDIGCGRAELLRFLPNEARYIGIDGSLKLLQEAKRAWPDAIFIQADFARLPFRDHSLRAIYSVATLEHVFSLEAAIAEAWRVADPDGRFYVNIPTEGGLAVDVARMVTSQRNAKLIGTTPAESRQAQRIDHCNTHPMIENALLKHFRLDRSLLWPFRIGGRHANIAKSYRLEPIHAPR